VAVPGFDIGGGSVNIFNRRERGLGEYLKNH